MPPLAFTHLKNAAAERGAELKSMPPLAVVSARILIGSPVASLPLAIPHFTALDREASSPTSSSVASPDESPHAASAAASDKAVAAATAPRRYFFMFPLLQIDISGTCGASRSSAAGLCRRRRHGHGRRGLHGRERVVVVAAQQGVELAPADAHVAAAEQ